MKIIELRFKNLNSLYGEWTIDFTDPAYVSNGIFAITGPTGSGKSTILDAICLALYGATPRLGKITQGGNEIMSRQTGECYAEVTFQTQDGKYRCHWSQHKARKKSDGKLADSKHEISEVVSGKIIESKKRNVASVIEKKTGMNFERFTRSILLAQGGFAAFLQASPDERAPILEQITGTEIYSEISKNVHARHREENDKLNVLKAETNAIDLLSDEQEKTFNQKCSETLSREKKLASENNELEKSIAWLVQIDKLKKELIQISEEDKAAKEKKYSFKPYRERLENAIKATPLKAEHAILYSQRGTQKKDIASLDEKESLLPQIEVELAQKTSEHKQAESAITLAKSNYKKELELMKDVRANDLHIKNKQVIVKKTDAEHQQLDAGFQKHHHSLEKVVLAQTASNKELGSIETYIFKNAKDEVLVAKFEAISEQIKNLKVATKNVSLKKDEIKKLVQQIENDLSLYKKQQVECNKLKSNYKISKKHVAEIKAEQVNLLKNTSLHEYRTLRDTLMRESAYLNKIASLEDERAKLIKGHACPLCGSKHHPFANDDIPQVTAVEIKVKDILTLIKKAETFESKLKKFENTEKEISLQFAEVEKKLIQAENVKNASETNRLRLNKELKEASNYLIKLQLTILSTLNPLGITELPPSKLDALVAALNDKRKKWQNHQLKKIEIEKENTVLVTELNSLTTALQSLTESVKQKKESLDSLTLELAKSVLAREKLYGKKDPDTEEKRLENLVLESEKKTKKTLANLDNAKQKLGETKPIIANLKKQIAQGKIEVSGLKIAFIASCKKNGLEDEKAFIACRMDNDEQKKLARQANEIDLIQADITTRKKDRETGLALELDKKITELPVSELMQQLEKMQAISSLLREEIGAIKQQLTNNKKAKEKYQQQQGLIESQKKECAKWDSLHLLIGSADGKKYRNFAQGLTFEQMVLHANKQLCQMQDRYLLKRDNTQPLELNVIDNYQAGEIRSTKNLSGGESFIVSLALALGLSKMASRKVRVDSLFLDEGFGTLDEDALETALEALASLHHDNKLIGVISHVPALKERISTQINVQPVSGGKSILTGPGCKVQ